MAGALQSLWETPESPGSELQLPPALISGSPPRLEAYHLFSENWQSFSVKNFVSSKYKGICIFWARFVSFKQDVFESQSTFLEEKEYVHIPGPVHTQSGMRDFKTFTLLSSPDSGFRYLEILIYGFSKYDCYPWYFIICDLQKNTFITSPHNTIYFSLRLLPIFIYTCK